MPGCRPGRAAGSPESHRAKSRALQTAIVGFELDVLVWRETLKLSQNKNAEELDRVTIGLEKAGATGIAALMRTLGQ